MKSLDLKKVRRNMEKALDASRFEHTLGVEYTAAALAMRYDSTVQNAQLAGLLHDCAKCLPDEKKLSICEKHNISINSVERRQPYLLHAKVGSFLAMEEYGVEDRDIINAILNHTTGRPGMSVLEKIVFVADYIEPNRKMIPGLPEVRKLAFEDLDHTVLRILEQTLVYLENKGAETDPMTRKTCDYYKKLLNEKPMEC